MTKTLVIVESAGKIKKISKILGDEYIVMASAGHIIDLDSKKISVDINNNFEPKYVINKDKKDLVNKLKKMAENKNVLLAADADREGEMIAWSLAKELKLVNPNRLIFTEITEKALFNAIKNPTKLNMNLVNAQKSRGILDRIIGYKLSPLLWKHLGNNNLSAGRVLSVIVKLIIEKENKIKEFFNSDTSFYFKISSILENDNNELKCLLYEDNEDNKHVNSLLHIETYEEAKNITKLLMLSEFKIEDILDKESIRKPQEPFETSSLQQEASNKLGMNSKKTMTIAQKLYEMGLITYVRTDSIAMSEEILTSTESYINTKYGNKYYNRKIYVNNGKNCQEAHECIRPTDIFKDNLDNINLDNISNDEIRLYELIWKRTVASQMSNAIFKIFNIKINISKTNKYYFNTIKEQVIFDGYLKVYNILDVENNEDVDIILKNKLTLKIGMKLQSKIINTTQEYKQPTNRYNEATLISQLKKLGIGRPATYAPFIEKIIEKKYAVKENPQGIKKDSLIITVQNNFMEEKKKEILIGKELNRFVPTSIAELTNTFLIKNFPTIIDYKLTSNLEDDLDKIANNNLNWIVMLKTFCDEFINLVDTISKTLNYTNNEKLLGLHPKHNFEIFAITTKYGDTLKYIDNNMCKYANIDYPLTVSNITLEEALKILEYPKILGTYNNNDILLNKGKYGFYLSYNNNNYSVKVNNIDLDFDEAIKIIEEQQYPILFSFKDTKKHYTILNGKYGKYINIKSLNTKSTKPVNIPLPKDINITDINMEKINDIINANKTKPVSKKYNKKN